MVYKMQEGEAILLPPGIDTLFNCCCDCGLWHHIDVERRPDGTIALRWERMDGPPDYNEWDDVTMIEKPDGRVVTYRNGEATDG